MANIDKIVAFSSSFGEAVASFDGNKIFDA